MLGRQYHEHVVKYMIFERHFGPSCFRVQLKAFSVLLWKPLGLVNDVTVSRRSQSRNGQKKRVFAFLPIGLIRLHSQLFIVAAW